MVVMSSLSSWTLKVWGVAASPPWATSVEETCYLVWGIYRWDQGTSRKNPRVKVKDSAFFFLNQREWSTIGGGRMYSEWHTPSLAWCTTVLHLLGEPLTLRGWAKTKCNRKEPSSQNHGCNFEGTRASGLLCCLHLSRGSWYLSERRYWRDCSIDALSRKDTGSQGSGPALCGHQKGISAIIGQQQQRPQATHGTSSSGWYFPWISSPSCCFQHQ